jgi:hypothetical protein
MREFDIAYLEDGACNAVLHIARLFDDWMVGLSAGPDDLRAVDFHHRLMEPDQVVGATLQLAPEGSQLHITLLERSIRKKKLRHQAGSPLK